MYAGEQSKPTNHAYSQLGGVSEATRIPELPAAMERVNQSLEGILYAIDNLDGRLTSVVARSVTPSPETKQSLKAAMNTGFGAQLDSINERLQMAHLRLQGLTDRLEF